MKNKQTVSKEAGITEGGGAGLLVVYCFFPAGGIYWKHRWEKK